MSQQERSNWVDQRTAGCLLIATACAALTDCSGSSASPSGVGGNSAVGGTISTMGGATSSAGNAPGGGTSTHGNTGGSPVATAGGPATGGLPSVGGMMATGGAQFTGGMMTTGGNKATGGGLAIGGAPMTGGSKSTGGMPATGGSKATGGMMATGGSSSAAAPTFTQIYAIISGSCLPCHATGTGNSVGMLNLSTQAMAYANLVGASGTGVPAAGSACGTSGLLRVEPGNSANSLLWEKVNGKLAGMNPPPCGSAMPLTGTALTPTQVNEIAAWIDAGAPND